MPKSSTSFQPGNQAHKGHKGAGGRPRDYSKVALRDALISFDDADECMRNEAIEVLRKGMRAKDMLGNVNTVALNSATKVLTITDPDAMGVGNDNPTGDIHVTIEYKGAQGFNPQNLFAPANAPRRPVENTAGKEAVQRRPVRKKVRKDNPRRDAGDAQRD